MNQPEEIDIELRVRYSETDAMGFVHHANYLPYLEMARTELFRAQGGNYRLMEERGYLLVVVKIEIDYKSPAKYDDVITVRVKLDRRSPAKLEHVYEVRRASQLLVKARTILACLNRAGEVQRITDEILFNAEPEAS